MLEQIHNRLAYMRARRRTRLEKLHCVFVVGCQRSGTTLIGQILGAHPNAVLIDENHGVYELMQRMLADDSGQAAALRQCLSRSRMMYARKTDRIGPDGCLASSITHLIFKVPNLTYEFVRLREQQTARMHFVFPVRDVRDVVCSMQRLAHIPMVQNQIEHIASSATLKIKCLEELTLLQCPDTPDHVRKSIIWRIKTGLQAEFTNSPLNALQLKYEDLVSKPRIWIPRLLEHVQLDDNAANAYHHEDQLRGLGPGLTRRSREIDNASIGRWQQQLTTDEERDIWRTAGGLMKRLGYERRLPDQHSVVEIHPKVLSSPVVAIGRGGSGTRLLSLALQEHSVFLGNQLNKRCEDSVEWVDPVYELSIRKLKNILPQNELWHHDLTAAATRILRKGSWNHDQPWGWKLPESMLIVPEILQVFPDARLIHLVRHPLDVCLRRSHVTSRIDNEVGKAVLCAAYQWLNWKQNPDDDPDHIRNAASWAWQVDQVARYGRSLNAERYLEVKYEDLCRNPQPFSDRLADFLGQSNVSTHISDVIDQKRFRSWTTDDSRVRDVWSVCEQTARSVGYEMPDLDSHQVQSRDHLEYGNDTGIPHKPLESDFRTVVSSS